MTRHTSIMLNIERLSVSRIILMGFPILSQKESSTVAWGIFHAKHMLIFLGGLA